jgi:hypothetical protein
MPYKVNIQEEKDYLRVEVSGERRPGHEVEDSVATWSHVAKICEEKKKDHVLGVFNVSGRLPTPAAYALAFNPESYGWSRRLKLALVVIHEESRQDALFVEDVAVSSGYKIRIFDNEEKAIAWLFVK